MLLAVTGCTTVSAVHRDAVRDAPAQAWAHASAPAPVHPLAASPPTWIRIPAISLSAPVGPVGTDAAGALEPPATDTGVGWWKGGVTPGQAGSSVLVGHLDSRTGPAVFAGLSVLKAGDSISVDRADGSTAVFEIRSTALYRQDAFPTAAVYGPVTDPELRLITCGGAFDRTTYQYLGNRVVYAVLRSTTRRQPRHAPPRQAPPAPLRP